MKSATQGPSQQRLAPEAALAMDRLNTSLQELIEEATGRSDDEVAKILADLKFRFARSHYDWRQRWFPT